MSNYPRQFSRLILSLFIFIALAASNALAGDDWKLVDQAALSLKSPVVEHDADAEALFWEVRIDDDQEDLVTSNYIRIKIFTDRGRESESKVEIPYIGDTRIKDIAARTIKPDGSIVELKKEDVFDKTIIKAGDIKLRAKTFAMPSVEPGAIIEYRWREVRPGAYAQYMRLRFQRDIPVQSVTYYIKPSTHIVGATGMRFQPFHMKIPQFTKEKSGFYSSTLTNIPAYHEEPRMPPEDQVRMWMLIYYSEDQKIEPGAYWKNFGKHAYDVFKSDIKANDEVRQKATEIVGDATTPDQKLQRLYDYCRTQIKNLSDDASGLSDDDRAKLKSNKSPADTIKRKQGTSSDIGKLFGALTTAAGFDTHVALMANRSDIFFDPNFASPYFIDLIVLAVKVDNDWKFFDPSETYVPYGMLPWYEEGQDALIADSKEPGFVKTPISAPAKSTEKRTAKLKLSDDGTLEGDVHIEYTGHLANEKKEYNDDDSPAQREQTLRDNVKKRMSTAELSNIKIENVQDPIKPFVYDYHISVPGYAQRTGKRLFLQPAFFEHGTGPLFPTADRQNEVYFHYPWAEDDNVEITLPDGFALENPDAPVPINAGETSKYDVHISISKDGHKLFYRRSFYFGITNQLSRFPTTIYPTLKQLFDEMNKRDNHTLTLKQGAATSTSSN